MVAAAVGITISPLELCAAYQSSSGAREVQWRAPLEPWSPETPSWPSLAHALRELARAIGAEGGSLSIALMPPFAEVRTLDLPTLRDDEMRMLVSRNAQRYFTTARGAQIIGLVPTRRKTADPVVAAAAPARLIYTIHAAAKDAGWTVARIMPVESAWAAAARGLWPPLARKSGGLLVAQHDRTDLVLLRDGQVASVRRFRSGAVDVRRIAEALASLGAESRVAQVGIVGSSESRKELVSALASLGITASGPATQQGDVAAQHDRLAATFADRATELEFRTEDVRSAREGSARRAAMFIGAAALLLLVLAGVFELWSVRRQLTDVQAQRAALKPQLSSTLVGRTTIETAYRQLGVLNAAERSAPQWTSLMVSIAKTLDQAAYITAFKGRGDSVVIEGIAAHAAKVFEDLEHTPGLASVTAAAPVRREAPNGADATQRFTIAARVASAPASVPAAVPVKRGAK